MSIALEEKISYILISEIHQDNDFNCRQEKITPGEVRELVKSIEENGLLHPVTIRNYSEERQKATGFRFGLICGYRRIRAFELLNRQTIPCVIKENITDLEARRLNFIENEVRHELNVLQEAKTIEKFRIAGLTIAEIAESVGKSPGWVQLRLTLLKFSENIQQEFAKGKLGQQYIPRLSTLSPELRAEEVKRIKNRKEIGEKNIVVKRPTSQLSRRARTTREIAAMRDHIYDNLDASFTTRALAWCVGTITSAELFNDIKEQCKEIGKHYVIPEEELT